MSNFLGSTFLDYLQTWQAEKCLDLASKANDQQIINILNRDNLSPEDFLLLLTPNAQSYLEDLAQKAQKLSLQFFGKTLQIFTPLYLSNYCTNHCRYCGFNSQNKIERSHLKIQDAITEAKIIKQSGILQLLLLTGDTPTLASVEYLAEIIQNLRADFASLGLEIYALTEAEYSHLVKAGADSMTMFQETYNAKLYDYLHPKGPKKDYAFRLAAPERAARAGFRSLGLGALLGLDEFLLDAFYTGLHAYWLQRQFPGVEISISIPRIRPHVGSFEVPHPISDRQFVQYVIALRCFLPRCGITCSSRETATMRNNLVNLGVSRISASVSTAVGGRRQNLKTEQENQKNQYGDLNNATGQFEIADSRSLAEIQDYFAKHGWQIVLKDWEDLQRPLIN